MLNSTVLKIDFFTAEPYFNISLRAFVCAMVLHYDMRRPQSFPAPSLLL
jgi:hypothetical protein